MVKKIDKLGRIVIPIEFRRRLKMNIGTPCEFHVTGDDLILRRQGSVVYSGDAREVGDEWKGICPYCKYELMERFNKTCCGNCGNKIIWEKNQRKV